MMMFPSRLKFSDVSFMGEDDGDLLGWAVDSAGDIDGDGLGDIVFSPRSDRYLDDAGAVYVFWRASIPKSRCFTHKPS